MDADQLDALVAAIGAPRPDVGGGRKLPAYTSGNPTDWLEWRMTFNNIATLKAWDDARKITNIRASVQGYAVTCISGVEYGPWVAVVAVVGGPGVAAVAGVVARGALTSEEILDAYEAKFVTSSNSKYARQEFLDAVQNPDEALVMWHTRLSMLYRRSEPNADMENARELREHFIRGLLNRRVKEQVMDFDPPSMSDALRLATNKAATIAVLKKEDDMRRDGRKKGTPAGLFAVGVAETNQEEGSAIGAMDRRCYNCNQVGHLQRNCSQPAKKRSNMPNNNSFRRPDGGRGRRPQSGGRGRGGRQGTGSGGNRRTSYGTTDKRPRYTNSNQGRERALNALYDAITLDDEKTDEGDVAQTAGN
jgi:hypothetical protein